MLSRKETRILREVPAAPGSNLTRYEIFHDALAPAVLDWRRRRQNERLREGQRIAVSAFQDAIASGLQDKGIAPEITSYVQEQVQKLSAVSAVVLAPGTLSGRSLLWVDDQPKNNIYESGLFRQAGMKVATATSTEEAKRQLGSSRFDLVISDVYRKEGLLGNRSAGYELLQWMRRTNHVMPFIFYTSDVNRIDTERAAEALGCADDSATLIEMVMRAVRRDDEQKGRWGGRPVRNYRRLDATVTRSGPSSFRIVLSVREWREDPLPPGDIDPGPLVGEVQFHLHQTFPSPVLKRAVKRGVACCELGAYGAFTVGAVADQGRTSLELDLALDPSFPQEFRDH
jgi:CheY-like chemotaxis protein